MVSGAPGFPLHPCRLTAASEAHVSSKCPTACAFGHWGDWIPPFGCCQVLRAFPRAARFVVAQPCRLETRRGLSRRGSCTPSATLQHAPAPLRARGYVGLARAGGPCCLLPQMCFVSGAWRPADTEVLCGLGGPCDAKNYSQMLVRSAALRGILLS